MYNCIVTFTCSHLSCHLLQITCFTGCCLQLETYKTKNVKQWWWRFLLLGSSLGTAEGPRSPTAIRTPGIAGRSTHAWWCCWAGRFATACSAQAPPPTPWYRSPPAGWCSRRASPGFLWCRSISHCIDLHGHLVSPPIIGFAVVPVLVDGDSTPTGPPPDAAVGGGGVCGDPPSSGSPGRPGGGWRRPTG